MSSKKASFLDPAMQATAAADEAAVRAKMVGMPAAEQITMAQHGTMAWNIEAYAGPLISGIEEVDMMLRGDPVAMAQVVAHAMKLPDCRDNLGQAIVRDYFVAAGWFARENDFTLQATSALVALMGELLKNCKEDKMSMEENLADFKDRMTRHSSLTEVYEDREAGRVFDFPPSAVPQVVAFAMTSVFQHYKMYEMLFHAERAEQASEVGLLVTVPTDTPPLDEAMSQAEWDDHHKVPGEEGNAAEDTGADGEGAAGFETTLSEEEVQKILEFTRSQMLSAAPDELKETLAEALPAVDLNITSRAAEEPAAAAAPAPE